MRTSANVSEIRPSATLAVAALAKQLAAEGHSIIDLSAGEPDFPTPERVARAGIRAIEAGYTRYTPVTGLPELRRAIAAELERDRSVRVDPAGIIVSTGAKQALFNACFSLFGPGDRVLVPVPYWTSYPEILGLARAEPVFVRGDEGRGFRVTPADLDAVFDDHVRGLLLNSPSNPSGAVYPLEEVRALVDWARERDVAVVSDEIYNRICFVTDRAAGLLDVGELEAGHVVIGGASKNYAMTGWRIGFSYADPALSSRMSAVQSHITSGPNTPAQHAALAAFDTASDGTVSDMRDAFRGRRDLVTSLFERHLPDSRYVQPDGAFYVFFRIDGWFDDARPDSIAFCRWLIEEAGVALVPGAAFGDDRYVRLSYAAAESDIMEGIERLAAALSASSAAGAGA